jgi:ribosomal protein S12
MTQKKTHQSKKANGVTKAATVRLANGLTGIEVTAFTFQLGKGAAGNLLSRKKHL